MYERIESENLSLKCTEENPFDFVKDTLATYYERTLKSKLEVALQYDENEIARHIEVPQISIDKSLFKFVFDVIMSHSLQAPYNDGNILCSLAISNASNPQVAESSSRILRRASLTILPMSSNNHDQLFTLDIIDNRSTIHQEDIDLMNNDSMDFKRRGRGDGANQGFKLWLARKIVHKHGGYLSISRYSDKNRIKFSLCIPLVDKIQLRRNSISDIEEKNEYLQVLYMAPTRNGRTNWRRTNPRIAPELHNRLRMAPRVAINSTYSVLIVDDSSLVRKMVIKLMMSLGHTCIEADDGDTAVNIIRDNPEHNIDIILIDYQMPRMLGTIATEIIRKELKFTGVVIGVTGNATAADIDEFLVKGADDVIVKPLTSISFAKTIKTAINKGSGEIRPPEHI
jgi:CheY-like chemotaxis protein